MARKADIEKLIQINELRLQKLKEQKALYGLSVDPKVVLEIEEDVAKVDSGEN